MKIIIKVKSNGIHNYAILKAEEVETGFGLARAEVKLVEKLENVVNKYNKENIEKA